MKLFCWRNQRKENKNLKLFLLSQNINNGYNIFDSCLVCAENKKEAKRIHPDEGCKVEEGFGIDSQETWVKLGNVKVKYIGEADSSINKGLIISSFNAA